MNIEILPVFTKAELRDIIHILNLAEQQVFSDLRTINPEISQTQLQKLFDKTPVGKSIHNISDKILGAL